MAQWFAVQDKVTLRIVSYTTDDSVGFNQIDALRYDKLGPHINQAAAQLAHEGGMVVDLSANANALKAKPSATWTISDVADFLKTLR